MYTDQLFFKALVLILVRHLHKVHELLSVLAHPTAALCMLRQLVTEQECFPSRRTGERRLKADPATLPAQSGCVGRQLIDLIQPWATSGRAVAITSTVLRARGGVWHHNHRELGEVPYPSLDPQAQWTTAGWHGWVDGWKLHVGSVIAAVWFPIAAVLTPATVAYSDPAPDLLGEVPAEVRFLLGDLHYMSLTFVAAVYSRIVCWSPPSLDALPYRYRVEVRRIFHQLRSVAREQLHKHFKGIFDGHGQVPTTGLLATQRFA